MINKTIAKVIILVFMAMMPKTQTFAQDWKSIFSGFGSVLGEKVAEKISEKVDSIDFCGKWVYVKPDCKFESDDFFLKAGGEFAASKIEQRMTEVLTKLGLDEKAVFTFNADSTYTLEMGKRSMKGTYSVNNETKEFMMTSRLQTTFTATISYNVLNPGKVSLLFKADKLMDLAQNISGVIAEKSTSKTITAVCALLNKFDGLTLGFEMLKEGYEDKGTKTEGLLQ